MMLRPASRPGRGPGGTPVAVGAAGNQLPISWGRAPAQLGQVGRASAKTGRFRVGGSRCGP